MRNFVVITLGTLFFLSSWTGVHAQDNSTTPSCGGGGDASEKYDLGLHVSSFFVILVTSSFGAFVPVISKKYPTLRIPQLSFFITKHFGTGVILATAFIHMLPSGFGNLMNPCLPAVWSVTYPAFSGALAMAAALTIFFVEFAAVKMSTLDEDNRRSETLPTSYNSTEVATVGVLEPTPSKKSDDISTDFHAHGHTMLFTTKAQSIGIIILELGICLHSVIIGMALSVSVGSDFISLFCALIFHQLFEGLGLGARIAELNFQSGSWKQWLMSLAYGTTTPFGIAIGLGVRYSYDPNSQTAILVQGILDSISAGILLYTAMVELLAADFILDRTFIKESTRVQASAFCLVLLGASIMALIGRWA